MVNSYSCFGRGAERERGEAAHVCLNTFDNNKSHLLKRELREIECHGGVRIQGDGHTVGY